MANNTVKKGGSLRAPNRRPAGARKKQEGGACPEGLNLPRQSREEYVASVLEQLGAKPGLQRRRPREGE